MGRNTLECARDIKISLRFHNDSTVLHSRLAMHIAHTYLPPPFLHTHIFVIFIRFGHCKLHSKYALTKCIFFSIFASSLLSSLAQPSSLALFVFQTTGWHWKSAEWQLFAKTHTAQSTVPLPYSRTSEQSRSHQCASTASG